MEKYKLVIKHIKNTFFKISIYEKNLDVLNYKNDLMIL